MANPDSDRDDNQNPNQNPNLIPNQNPNQNQNQNPDNPNNVPNPNQPPFNPLLPKAPVVIELPRPQLHWSHFKPKYAGKPDKDAEAHLLRMNDWMDTHEFPDHVKVQRFCLTLIGETRLWYKPLRPIKVDWASLQNLFRQQYSKIGNTREQLFHAWRPFHFNENAEMIDTYVNRIRQVANLLGYKEPQILEVFKILFLQNYIGFSFL